MNSFNKPQNEQDNGFIPKKYINDVKNNNWKFARHIILILFIGLILMLISNYIKFTVFGAPISTYIKMGIAIALLIKVRKLTKAVTIYEDNKVKSPFADLKEAAKTRYHQNVRGK